VPAPLPLFGLNVPIVPGLVLPLHVFEPRYRELVASLLDEPDEELREFGIVFVREGHDPSTEGMDALFSVGVSVMLRQAERLDDGRYDIVTSGYRRFRLLAVDTSRPLLRGDIEWLDDQTGLDDAVVTLLAGQVARAFGAYRDALTGQVTGSVLEVDATVDGDATDDDGHLRASDLPADPTVLSYLVTAAMVLPIDERAGLVAAATTQDRLALALRLLRRETALIRVFGCVPALELPGPAPSLN